MSRAGWWAFLSALAVAAIAAHFARTVPGETAEALEAGYGAEALAEARALVRDRPVPAEHLLLLATAELRAGNAGGFEQAMRLATERGWRAEAVQVIAARSAFSQGDATGAANRLAALWAIGGTAKDLPAMTRELLALPGGPEAFGEPLARTRVWQDGFLARASEMGTPDQVARLLAAAEADGAEFNPD